MSLAGSLFGIFLFISVIECIYAYKLRMAFGVSYMVLIAFMPFIHSIYLFYKILNVYINRVIVALIMSIYLLICLCIVDCFEYGLFSTRDPICLFVPAIGFYMPVIITIVCKRSPNIQRQEEAGADIFRG